MTVKHKNNSFKLKIFGNPALFLIKDKQTFLEFIDSWFLKH